MGTSMINVLIIDDDPMVSHINRVYTEKIEGFKVLEEINIEKDLEINKDLLSKVDLLLLDIYLPDKSGIEILKDIRKDNNILDVIIITASKITEHISAAMQLGVVDYLIKPFTFERFKQSLEDYKNLCDKLDCDQGLNQSDIDLLMGKKSKKGQKNKNKSKEKTVKESYIRELPKGLNKSTLKNIRDFIYSQSDNKFTTKGLAVEIGLSRVTVQRYLKYLSLNNELEVIKKYGTVGRPKHYYRLISSKS
jgi:response regulator of citrate/malate metabolism